MSSRVGWRDRAINPNKKVFELANCAASYFTVQISNNIKDDGEKREGGKRKVTRERKEPSNHKRSANERVFTHTERERERTAQIQIEAEFEHARVCWRDLQSKANHGFLNLHTVQHHSSH